MLKQEVILQKLSRWFSVFLECKGLTKVCICIYLVKLNEYKSVLFNG